MGREVYNDDPGTGGIMSENGICSNDVSVKELIGKITTAETEIGRIVGELLPHCRVSGMCVFYKFSTSANEKGTIDVTLQYRII